MEDDDKKVVPDVEPAPEPVGPAREEEWSSPAQAQALGHQQWIDELHRTRLVGIRSVRSLLPLAIRGIFISVVLVMLIVVGTYVIHLFIPQFGWLDEEQEKRLFSGYSSFAQVAVPHSGDSLQSVGEKDKETKL